jgi:hypothetical protein
MAKYLFVYHGGGMAESEEERNESMAAWGRWAGDLGSAVVDFGAPIGATTTVGGDGGNHATGYSLIDAESLDAAAELAKGCPILASGGSVEVAETIAM